MAKVIVLGGGVAGMTAAQELGERGFEVVVYESRSLPGGKARSLPVPGSGTGSRHDLPAEHGFRFFPGFYQHVPDTMKRIPFAGQPGGVLDNLTEATRVQIARAGRSEIVTPAHFPQTLSDVDAGFRFVFDYATSVGIPPQEQAYFVERLLTLLSSCEKRRFEQWENQTWWQFSGAERRSKAYQNFLADGLTRSLVAAKAREMSARTGGYILLQLMFDMATPGRQVDRLLNGPTNDVWIDPWMDCITQFNVDYRLEHQVQALDLQNGLIAGVTVEHQGQSIQDSADYYVAALPVEVMRALATDEIKLAEPRLAGLHRLRTRWMNGIMFYLADDVSVNHGHTIYIDSAWALTSVSQRQFWPSFHFTDVGDGTVRGILSVDISDWEMAGTETTHKLAMNCSKEQIAKEVWAQMKVSLDDDSRKELERAKVQSWLDRKSVV